MSPETRPQKEIAVSNLSLLGKSVPWALIYPLEMLGHRVLHPAEFKGGFEFCPNRTVSGLQLELGLAGASAGGEVQSLMQSFRSEKTYKEARKHPNPAARLIFFALPERIASLDNIKRIQKRLGRDCPVVLLSEKEGDKNVELPRGQKLIQPDIETMSYFHAYTAEGLAEKANQLGYMFALDLGHIRRKQSLGVNLLPWQDSIPILLPNIYEVHVGAGRAVDQTAGIDSNKELADLYYGEKTGEIQDMMRLIRYNGFNSRVVIEIEADAIARLLGKKILTPGELAKAYQRIVNNISSLIY